METVQVTMALGEIKAVAINRTHAYKYHEFTNENHGAEPRRMNISGARNPNRTEPNQALQRTNMLVTDRAPSSTLRAKHVRR